MHNYSDYIVYVDESGDHGLRSIDKTYPIFVLAFCIFEKSVYARKVTGNLQEFKFKHFGHDMVVLHEHEMRKAKGQFAFLTDHDLRQVFNEDLGQLIENAPFKIIATYINKLEFKRTYGPDHDLYNVAIRSCLRRLDRWMEFHGQEGRRTHVVFEARGRKEDNELELEFRRVCAGRLPFDHIFAAKAINSCGLQVADLVARPIGQKCFRPHQPNRTGMVLDSKLAKLPDQLDFGLDDAPDHRP